MYQFSLDAYIELFNNSIDKSKRSQKLEERIQNLNDFHTYAVYRYVGKSCFLSLKKSEPNCILAPKQFLSCSLEGCEGNLNDIHKYAVNWCTESFWRLAEYLRQGRIIPYIVLDMTIYVCTVYSRIRAI